MNQIKLLALLAAMSLCQSNWACTAVGTPQLEQDIRDIPACDAKQGKCRNAHDLMAERFSIGRDDDPYTLSLLMRASPWHVFDADERIMQLDDLKQTINSMLKPGMTKIELAASWTATSRGGQLPSVVQQLSAAYPALTFSGVDGFAWITPNGKIYGTKQAFSIMAGHSYPYEVNSAQDIMLSFIDGLVLNFNFKQEALEKKQADALLTIAVAEESFGLCIDTALDTYVQAAQMGNTIAAYNAAVIYKERGETAQAREWLQQAAKQGDQPAARLLKQMDK